MSQKKKRPGVPGKTPEPQPLKNGNKSDKHNTTPHMDRQDKPVHAGNPEDMSAPTINDKISFSVVTKNNGLLTKKLSLNNGEIVKDGSQCKLGLGLIKKYRCTPEKFAKGLPKFTKSMALVHGVSEYEEAVICSRKKFDAVKNKTSDKPVITRTKDHLSYPDSPGLLMFDHDQARHNAVGEHKALKAYRPSVLRFIVSSVHPAFKDAAYVSTPSTSSCIYDKAGNELRGEGDGFHMYVFPKNARDITRYLDVLGKRLILAGYGRMEISRSGSLLTRTLIDLTVGSPERLDFVAGAVCMDGLEQRLPAPYHRPGELLETATLHDLTAAEEVVYTKIVTELIDKAKPAQKLVQEQYVDQESRKLSTESNISIDEAKKIVLSRQDHVLNDVDKLYFAHLKGKAVTVADVLNGPASYNNKSLADPLEPEYNGSMTTAKFYWNDGKNPVINSYAHGGIKYRFKRFEKNGRKIRFISARDLIVIPSDWLVKNYLEKETSATFFGEPGSMKTFMVMDMGLCIASGKDWHGNKVQQGSVLYICGEGQSGIKKRIQAWEIHHNMKAPLFFVSTCPAQMLASDSLEAVEKAAYEATDGRVKPVLIIIDTLNRNFGPGDENSTTDMSKFIRAVDQLRDRLKCAIGIVHHTGLADAKRGRGSSVLRGAMDFEYNCKITGSTIGEQTVTLTSTKTKDHESPPPITFNPIIVDLGIVDEENKPTTSLILESTDEVPSTEKRLSRTKFIALEALKTVTINGVGATEGVWRAEAYARGISPKGTPDSNKKAFSRAKNDLLDDRLIQKQDDLYLPTPSNTSDSGQGDKPGQMEDMSLLSNSNEGTDGTPPLKGCPDVPPGIEDNDDEDDFEKYFTVVEY